ncbi:MAG: hypothetical protein WCJ29_01940 [bacterium]
MKEIFGEFFLENNDPSLDVTIYEVVRRFGHDVEDLLRRYYPVKDRQLGAALVYADILQFVHEHERDFGHELFWELHGLVETGAFSWSIKGLERTVYLERLSMLQLRNAKELDFLHTVTGVDMYM